MIIVSLTKKVSLDSILNEKNNTAKWVQVYSTFFKLDCNTKNGQLYKKNAGSNFISRY